MACIEIKKLYSPWNVFKLLCIEINRVPFSIQNLAIPYNLWNPLHCAYLFMLSVGHSKYV